MITTRKRSGSNSKRPKEKILYIYEMLFKNEQFLNIDNLFWDEFFNFYPNSEYLESEFLKLPNLEQVPFVKTNINLLITQCIRTLDSENTRIVRNSLHTLCIIFYSIFKKYSNESGFEFLNTILVKDELDKIMRQLFTRCNDFLISDIQDAPRDVCLKLLLVFLTCVDNVNQNSLLEYLMVNSLFDSLIRLLSDPTMRASYGHDVVVLITLLVNYRKYEETNPYIISLSILADELALNGYGQVISSSLIEYCRSYSLNLSEPQTSWFSSLSNIVGQMFVSDEDCDKTSQIRANNALLLAFYEAIHLNRNFVTTLAHTQAETSSSPPSPSNTLNSAQVPDLASAPIIDGTQYPTNLFVAVFQYCSIVMQDHKNESSMTNLKLCLLILTCISEDQYANSMMHDSNLTFKVLLHRANMRHRKLPAEKIFKPRPLAATLLDLLVEFIVSHLMKKLPMELHLLCIGIIHRLIVYQKRCRIRLNFEWKNLWSALISLLKYLVSQEQHLIKKSNIFHLAIQVVNIFNLFITYGDTFLATTNSYDELYYELNREEKVFSEIHALVLRYTSMSDCEYKEDVLKLLNSLVNILTIIKHFQIKIKEWLVSQSLSTPTEEQILDVVRKNYDLTLKLQDSLDQYDRYVEKPKYTSFFTGIVKDVVADTKKSLYFSIRDLQNVDCNSSSNN